MDQIYEAAKKHALKNASDYGKADAKSVVGKVLAEIPAAKSDMKATMAAIGKAVAETNSMAPDAVKAALSNYVFEKQKKNDEAVLELADAKDGAVVTRFPPEPNGFPHIGHAKAALLNMDIAEKYHGTIQLRWDDTNPEAEKLEYTSAIKAGLEWLGIKFAKEMFVSDDIPVLYKYGKQLVSQGDAYVCLCTQDKMKEQRSTMKGCECRDRTIEDSADLWEGMLNGRFRHNQAVLRLKADMASLNTVMRDPVLFRIIETPHYRQKDKYRVWPTYDFDVCIEDSVHGVTHAMRSKEYELRDELYYFIIDKLKLRKPTMVEFSRLSIRGMPISKRLLKKLIADGQVSGWDDPRLPTLMGLKRRGILPQAITNYVRSFGLSKVESEPPIDRLLVENQRLLEPVANHYFFVASPVRLHVRGTTPREAILKKHPINDAGTRKLIAKDSFYIAGSDAEKLAIDETFRLKDLYNVKVLDKGTNFVEAEFAGDEGTVARKLQWVPNDGQAVPAKLLAVSDLLDSEENYRPESLVELDGYCEMDCKKLQKGDAVQFERVGFAVLDDEKKMVFVLSTAYKP